MIMHEDQIAVLESADTGQAFCVQLHTFKRAFAEICAGESPWIPLGNFMHQFFGAQKHRRFDLVCEPIEVPEQCPREQFQWAVFCAASAEYLCNRYEIPCPEWALHLRYTLADPWYYAIGADMERVREKLRQTTPEEFARRNVFCGDRTYRNKYEYKGRRQTA